MTVQELILKLVKEDPHKLVTICSPELDYRELDEVFIVDVVPNRTLFSENYGCRSFSVVALN
jgi:hypothetical protein